MLHAAITLVSVHRLTTAEGFKGRRQGVIEAVDRHGSAVIRPEYPIVQAGDVHHKEVHSLSVLIRCRE